MASTKSEKTASYELLWSLERNNQGEGSPALKFNYQLKAIEELYVSDRLWDLTNEGRRIPDPFGVYRFVSDGRLLLVFAQAPAPPNVYPRIRYEPLFSRIAAGETRKNSVLLSLPVEEYSGLQRNTKAPSEDTPVSGATLVLGYRLRSTLAKDPEPPLRESEKESGYVVHDPQLIISSLDIDPLPVKKRVHMARFVLP